MYSRLKNVQILISLLKKHGIKNLVLSAGQSNNTFVRSVETDSDFTCYSVVDERSAAFFAMGLSQQLNEPVALSCTASTACCNYLSAITEAFYQQVPLVVITSNRDPKDLDQLQLLMIHQADIFKDVTKRAVQLPRVTDFKSFLHCQREVNATLLELDHYGKGPVHIDVPNYGDNMTVDVPELPVTRVVRRCAVLRDDMSAYADKLKKAEKIMLLCGQARYTDEEKQLIRTFAEKYNCIVAAEHMANIGAFENCININPLISNMGKNMFEKFCPDILISLGKRVQFAWSSLKRGPKFEHWIVNESGVYYDPSDRVTNVFEGTDAEFLKYFIDANSEGSNNCGYRDNWKLLSAEKRFSSEKLTHINAIGCLARNIPENSILHLSILNSIRVTQFYTLPDNVTCYANLGALGIDGCMSSFLGQAAATDQPAFLVIGDLSFFYDMNALMIRHIKNNVHILLLNNHGGAEFYQNNGLYDTLDLHSAARHHRSARAWIESSGFEYMTANSLAELREKIPEFVKPHSTPVLMEVFTDMETDMNELSDFRKAYASATRKDSFDESVKKGAKGIFGEKGVKMLKGVLKK